MPEFLSRDQIFSAQARQFQEVEVPEWGGRVMIRSLLGVERDDFESSLITGRGRNRQTNLRNLRAKLVSVSVVDPVTHELMFTQADIMKLGQLNAAALDRVFSASQILSGLRDEDVDDLAGNSEGEQSEGSGSSSPSVSAA